MAAGRKISPLFSGSNRLTTAVIGVLCLGVLVLLVNVWELHSIHSTRGMAGYGADVEATGVGPRKRAVWIFAKNLRSGYLKHVQRVFARCGYTEADGSTGAAWDVLWTHDYPFKTLKTAIHAMRPFQRLNHYPGTGYITNKVSLATSKISFIPPAFKMPKQRQDLLAEIEKHPDKLWVQKSNNHRGIKIRGKDDLELNKDGTFVQEFVAKPFLIDGYKFDIGIYTVLTSIDPLRVYIVEDEFLLRFCGKPYHPFSPADTRRYVVEDDYTPTWEIKSLKPIYELTKHSFKETFRYYLTDKGYNAEKVFSDIRKAIAGVYREKEQDLIRSTVSFANTRVFFEMVRFDFVLDEDLNLYLMEVNMSPNLSSGHFAPNQDLYEHVVFNMMNLVGVCRATGPTLENSNAGELEMQVGDRFTRTETHTCMSQECRAGGACSRDECQLCEQCLSTPSKQLLRRAYSEHVSRRGCRRVLPDPIEYSKAKSWGETTDPSFKNMTSGNKLLTRWFVYMCRQDSSWCN